MKYALVTGATGYLGSTIAAWLLSQGYHIVALYRGDSGRVQPKIQDGAVGCQISLPEQWQDSITEVLWQQEEIDDCLSDYQFDAIFHCAAMMSFSPLQLEDSYDFNLNSTLALYNFICQQVVNNYAQNPPRFFYLSTAYTGGIGREFYPEQLHYSAKIINPYQASKWSAEMALFVRSQFDDSIPISIVRPTVVVGHSQTGWYGGSPHYGMYSYIEAVIAGMNAGAKEVRFNISPDVAHDYLFIDTFIRDIQLVLENDTADFL